tara:strand:- start:379 stop:750 length:372 start_codon:yes stop_codon:yes gene_type:complete
MNFLNLNIPGLSKGLNKYGNERYSFRGEEIYMLSCMIIDGTHFLSVTFEPRQKETAIRIIKKFGLDNFKPTYSGGMSGQTEIRGWNCNFRLEMKVYSSLVNDLKDDGTLSLVNDGGRKTLELV